MLWIISPNSPIMSEMSVVWDINNNNKRQSSDKRVHIIHSQMFHSPPIWPVSEYIDWLKGYRYHTKNWEIFGIKWITLALKGTICRNKFATIKLAIYFPILCQNIFFSLAYELLPKHEFICSQFGFGSKQMAFKLRIFEIHNQVCWKRENAYTNFFFHNYLQKWNIWLKLYALIPYKYHIA